jgi:glutaminyl-tRNA synthetase
MADAITEGAAKLQLDEETGEMVSKGELKKRLAKRAKKAAQATAKATAPPKESAAAQKPIEKEETVVDINAMFKEGFLDKVYKERPVKDVITRFPPEPNGPTHWARKSHCSQLWICQVSRRGLLFTVRRHQPRSRRREIL